MNLIDRISTDYTKVDSAQTKLWAWLSTGAIVIVAAIIAFVATYKGNYKTAILFIIIAVIARLLYLMGREAAKPIATDEKGKVMQRQQVELGTVGLVFFFKKPLYYILIPGEGWIPPFFFEVVEFVLRPEIVKAETQRVCMGDQGPVNLTEYTEFLRTDPIKCLSLSGSEAREAVLALKDNATAAVFGDSYDIYAVRTADTPAGQTILEQIDNISGKINKKMWEIAHDKKSSISFGNSVNLDLPLYGITILTNYVSGGRTSKNIIEAAEKLILERFQTQSETEEIKNLGNLAALLMERSNGKLTYEQAIRSVQRERGKVNEKIDRKEIAFENLDGPADAAKKLFSLLGPVVSNLAKQKNNPK